MAKILIGLSIYSPVSLGGGGLLWPRYDRVECYTPQLLPAMVKVLLYCGSDVTGLRVNSPGNTLAWFFNHCEDMLGLSVYSPVGI